MLKPSLAALVAVALIAVVAVGLPAGTAIATDTAAAAIAARKKVFDDFKNAMQAIKGVFDARGPLADVVPHAEVLSAGAARLPGLFPLESAHGDTKTRATLWDDFPAIERQFDTLGTTATTLATAGAAGDFAAAVGAFRAIAGGCKGCHDDYRL